MKRILLLIALALFNVSVFADTPTLNGGRMKFDFSDSSWKLTDGGVGEVIPHASKARCYNWLGKALERRSGSSPISRSTSFDRRPRAAWVCSDSRREHSALATAA